MADAARDLLAVGASGLQLTPGNAPTPGFLDVARSFGVPLATHHGFTAHCLRRIVWAEDGTCRVDSDSVHPPPRSHPGGEAFWSALQRGEHRQRCLEVMYPGYYLGDDASLRLAMDLGQRLAVDVSHLFMQRTIGDLRSETLAALFDYPHIAEIHVSANDGRRDAHRPIDAQTFGLSWAKERAAQGTPIILECYMHRLSVEQRRAQLAYLAAESS